MTVYITLFLGCLIVTLFHLGFIVKKYSPKLIPIVWNDTTNWNSYNGGVKLFGSIILLVAPCLFVRAIIEFNYSDDYFNYVCLILVNFLFIFCFWADFKKIPQLKENKFLNIKTNPNQKIKEDLEKLKLKKDKLEEISTNIINKVDHNYKITKEKLNQLSFKQSEQEKTSNDIIIKVDNSSLEITGLKKINRNVIQSIIEIKEETKQNKSYFDKGVTEVRKIINNNKADFTNNFKETNNEIFKINTKLEPKERKSPKRERSISIIKSQFDVLISDLNHFPDYNSNKKILIHEKYNISELQAYQILLLFFQKKYNFDTKYTNEIIYSLFNKYFGNLKEMKKSNWKEYKFKKHLTDVENEELYTQLEFYIKKTTLPLTHSS